MNNIPGVKLSKLQAIIKNIENNQKNNGDIEISFEFLMASCFPTCYKNIQNEMQRQYTLGYAEGMKVNEPKD